MPLALAASLVLVVAGAFVYEVTARSTQVMAAELTADHLKCFRVINNVLGTHHEPQAVESSMASGFDWQMHLPGTCRARSVSNWSARGRASTAKGSWRTSCTGTTGIRCRSSCCRRSARAEELVEVMGHQAAIWSVGNRTFVLSRASLAPRSSG